MTAVEVVGAQRLQVTRELLTAVFVVAGVPGPEIGAVQFQLVQQFFIIKRVITDDVDVADGGDIAFIHVNAQRYPVTRQRLNGRFDTGVITALGDVLTLELQRNTVKRCALEDITFRQATLLQTFKQRFIGNRFIAIDFNAGDGRQLDQLQNQDIAVAIEFDVVEETFAEQTAAGFGQTYFVDLIADRNRKRTENRAG